MRTFAFLVTAVGLCFVVSTAGIGQVVINEVVKEQRNAGSGGVDPDTREFVELYNAGSTAVDLSGWTLGLFDLASGAPSATDTIPSGTIQPGGYFVIGGAAVPNVNFSPVVNNLYPDVQAHVMELRNGAGALVDAVAYEIFRGTGLANATAEQLAQVGSGFQGQLFSLDAIAPNVPASWSRYRDGRDTNRNGLDFGFQPLTPGVSNNLPLNPSHTIPDVDAQATGTELAEYHSSFILPTVIEPGVADANNPRALPMSSPQGGKAIVAWDSSGGGNTVYSKELVNRFDLYAYFDTTPLGVASATNDEEWETSVYGIGSADPFFANPDPTGGISSIAAVTQNGATGIGWMYQQFEDPTSNFSKLVLIDFGDGGNSDPAAMEWDIIQEIDLASVPSGWYRLGIEYDPATGEVTATFDDDAFEFTTNANRRGTFFVGYREGITGAPSARFELHNPPIYDLLEASPASLAGDYNDNGVVDAADYVVWRDNSGTNNTLPNNSLPGPIGPAHYDQWRANFGRTAAGGPGGLAAGVPEPCSMALVACGVVALVRVQCRRSAARRG
jgi:hypothetical protein